MRIALLEDDPAQTELIETWLTEAGHSCTSHGTVKQFHDALSNDTFDLLIVDWNLPDGTGIEAVTWAREKIDWHVPVLFITSRDQEEDVVTALNAGADDYITKPAKQLETLARLKALERRLVATGSDDEVLDCPPFIINAAERQILVYGNPADLTHTEFELALVLFRNTGRLLSRRYLLEKVWGTTADLNTRKVDTHTSRLRIKLGIHPDCGWRLNAIYHHGYRLEHIASAD
jgi:DNA-binding response OmpR family regulator